MKASTPSIKIGSVVINFKGDLKNPIPFTVESIDSLYFHGTDDKTGFHRRVAKECARLATPHEIALNHQLDLVTELYREEHLKVMLTGFLAQASFVGFCTNHAFEDGKVVFEYPQTQLLWQGYEMCRDMHSLDRRKPLKDAQVTYMPYENNPFTQTMNFQAEDLEHALEQFHDADDGIPVSVSFNL